MSQIAIHVSGIGKEYRIGEKQERYKTLRDTLVQSVMRPARVLRSALGRNGAARSPEARIWALRNISLEVKTGEVVGVIGSNGAGKSTFLKILSRITEPTEGHAEIRGRVGSLLEVGTGFHPELTGRENIYLNGAILGMKRAEIDSRFDEIVAFSEVEKFVDTPVKHYSSGMYLRLAFAVAAHLEPEVLLVDEVLAVGDASFQKKCLAKMRDVAQHGQTVLFVSHNLEAILSLCTRCVVLSKGGVAFDSGPQEAVQFYHKSTSAANQTADDSVLYQEAPGAERSPVRVTRIEMLDEDRRPKSILSTWDDAVFRIHYTAPEDLARGSVILDIRDYKDQRLMVLDSGDRVPVGRGSNYVDCFLPRMPLSAGEYFLTIGITDAYVDWVWRKFGVGVLRVYGKDVYEIGRPPVYSRMAIAAPCEWTAPVVHESEKSQRISTSR